MSRIISMEYTCSRICFWYLLLNLFSIVLGGLFEYDYSLKRDAMKKEEQKFSGYVEEYTEDEKIVNNYLQYIKWEEFERTRDDFPPARPIKLHLEEVKKSNVYRVLKKFPKGGNMHLHHNHVVRKSKILDFVFDNPDLKKYLYVNKDWELDFFTSPPDKWSKVEGNLSKETLLKHLTYLNTMDDNAMNKPTDSKLRWSQMQPLFDKIGSQIINQVNITRLHMKALLEAAKEENVQYLETKVSAKKKLYVLDPGYTETNGKRFIDNDDGEMELNEVQAIVDDFKKNNPTFIGYKRIISSYRLVSQSKLGRDLEKALRLHKKYPDLVCGFDMVGEEDNGNSLLFFLHEFAKTKSLPYFFHTSETNWPAEYLTSRSSNDLVATIENAYDAILLGAKRVGHGLGYLSHPYLMEVLKQRKVAVEANPVSNKMLGYVPDQRHHPAITYLRYGIPVVLGADDPATFGYDEFTVDWYEAFMGWGLNLADLRQLAMNSLMYSSLSQSKKTTALETWKKSWNVFIKDIKAEACRQTFTNVIPEVSSIYPKDGHIKTGTNIKVFGRNFHVSICKPIVCRFGDMSTKGSYLYNHVITCTSPVRNTKSLAPLNVPFSVSFGNLVIYHGANLTFSYIHEIDKKDTSNSNSLFHNVHNFRIIYTITLFLLLY